MQIFGKGLLVIGFLVIGFARGAAAITLGVGSNFGDGGIPTADGWGTGAGGNPNVAAIPIADLGQNGVGDHAMLYNSNASGFHIFNFSNPTFLGNYAAVGAGFLQFDARHSGTGDQVDLRVYLFGNGFSTHDISTSVVTILPTDTTWTTYSIPIDLANLISFNLPGISITSVDQIGLRHDPPGTGSGTGGPLSSNTTVFFDNIVVLPVPFEFESTLSLIALGCMFGASVYLKKRKASKLSAKNNARH